MWTEIKLCVLWYQQYTENEMTSLRCFQQPKRQHQQCVTPVRVPPPHPHSRAPLHQRRSLPVTLSGQLHHSAWCVYSSTGCEKDLNALYITSAQISAQGDADRAPDNAVAERYYPKHCSSRFKMLEGRELLEKRPHNIPAVPINWLLYVLQNVFGNFTFFYITAIECLVYSATVLDLIHVLLD